MPQELYVISLVFSCLALFVSAITAWLTFFRNGELKATQPTTVFFGPDGLKDPLINVAVNKVYLRTLLYSTSKKGQVIESMHVSLRRNESNQNFSIWVYGTEGGLQRGSGLFVPQEGVTFDHHFLLPTDGASFNFLPGQYSLTMYAKQVDSKTTINLTELTLTVSEAHALQLSEAKTGIFFDWGPDQKQYHAHTKKYTN
ncbi:hypothetical protein KJY73_06575 [Bowmanella sp. Y26]|uniref:hypothetical protein n=1 Tax=Bowmanella yangjiangensis TaxID=2811230 RepID=UPI001BDD96D6|nr:hypothetical protein [Bowmanella yangjiangensis]MBT1063231.1 hypothetical protein [Bowmanella yangjiangensis]